jgi:hypothetical protein
VEPDSSKYVLSPDNQVCALVFFSNWSSILEYKNLVILKCNDSDVVRLR